MSKIERFEDLVCWQKGRELIKSVYIITSTTKFNRDYSLKDQIRRAAVSIILNIAEGFGRRTHKDFKHFLFIAHGSTSELQSALYVSLDLNYIEREQFDMIYIRCEEVSKIISGLIKSLN